MQARRELLALFDWHERRHADGFGVRREVTPHVVRQVGLDDGPSWIIHSRLGGADVEAVIQDEIAAFAALGRPFEWKHYDYDHPADLRTRLARAGFEIADEEQLMVLDLHVPPPWLDAPPAGGPAATLGVDAPGSHSVAAGGAELLDDLITVAEVVWSEHSAWMRRTLAAELRARPDETQLFVAYANGQPVAGAWVRHTPDSPFLGLYGAATLPAARGRGHYRALVAARAHFAQSRGWRYLSVEAGPMSAPILRRLGFEPLAVTTPCLWRPHSDRPA